MPNDDAVNASDGEMDEIDCELEEFKRFLPDDLATGESSQDCCESQLEGPCNCSEETLAVSCIIYKLYIALSFPCTLVN